MPRRSKPAPTRSSEDVDEVCLAFNLRRASRLVSQVYDDAYRFMGLRNTQFSLLYALTKVQPATVQELAKQLDVERTTLTRNLAPLEKDGFLTVTRGEDQREKRIELTEKGTKILAEGFPAWCAIQDRIEAMFGSEATNRLINDLRRLADTLS
ncbi:MAG: transcriptional regulator, MarR family [Akkermansiaceae bacterium]|nr:transcriptional regulator, MarR family [Akkermansiaceae bacterium]